MRNHLRMLIKSISLISFTLLLIGCQSKVNDEFIRISVNKKTTYYYECNLKVVYNKDSIVIKTVTNDSINTNESLLVLRRQNESFVLVSNKVLMRNDNKLRNKEILSTKDFHYSVFDTLTQLNDAYKIDVYNYRRGEEFISTISQYYKPQSLIRIYYNKDFRIHKVKVVFGVDEFIFESSKYKMDAIIDEKTIVYPKFLNDMKRDSLKFLKENQHDEWTL